jgi:hypothetical protein
MPRFSRWSHFPCIVICVMLLAGIGCQAQQRKTFADKIETLSGKKLRTTPQQLRLKIHHAALPLSGIIEAHADQILAETTDPAVRKNTLLWKINGIPAIHQVAFQPDPFLAFVDLWVLTIQMTVFFEDGAGKEALGRWHTIALEGSRKLESIVETLAREASADGDITIAQAKLNDWCRENPVESLYFIRKSITVVLASEIGTQSLGTFDIAAAMAVGVADLSQQMAAYADYLPKQARWQAELLLEGMTATEKIDQALSEFIRVSRDIDRITALAETAPETVSAERAIILKALGRDLDRALAALEKERIAVMADLNRERVGMSADITAERIAMLAEIDRQRQETLVKVEAIGKHLLDDALEKGNAKIDLFFIRTLQVGGLLVFVVLCFCTGAIYYIHGRRRRNSD